jgi:dihydroorotate dehydrogenase
VIIRKYLFSFFYRATRFLARIITSLYQFIFNKKQDLESIVDFGDRNLVKIDKLFGGIAYQFLIPDNLEVELFDLKFKSPIIASSFKSDKNLIGIWLKLGLGGAILKTIMKDERKGNSKPRLQQVRLERQACLVNALGLPGEGVEKFSKAIIDNPLWNHKKPIGLSIGGENLDDYIKTFNVLDTMSNKLKSSKYFFELNISCPNTDTGSTIGENIDELETLINHIRAKNDSVVSVKISPDWNNDHLKKIGEVIKSKEKMIINAGNTQFKTIEYLGFKNGSLPRGGGGLSGVAIFPRTLELVNLFNDMNLKIMATGGISTIHHLNAVKDAGASLYGLATALIMDPYCIPKINYALSRVK